MIPAPCGATAANIAPHQAAANSLHGRLFGSSPQAALTFTSVSQTGRLGDADRIRGTPASRSGPPPQHGVAGSELSPSKTHLSVTALSQYPYPWNDSAFGFTT